VALRYENNTPSRAHLVQILIAKGNTGRHRPREGGSN